MTTQNTGGTGSSQSSHSRSETGHIKNVANFNVLLSTCLGFGASYNPSNAAITTTAMQTLYPLADAAVTNTTNLGNSLQQSINGRANAFADVKRRATRLMAALKASGADAETIKNAKAINRKIQGSRAVPVSDSSGDSGTGGTGNTNPGGATGVNPAPSSEKQSAPPPSSHPINISVSQQSFDRLIANFKSLINYASQVSSYNPNETDLKIAALTTYLGTLQVANNLVITATVSFNNSLAARTKLLYDSITGLVHIAYEVKQYVISVFGARSMEAKQVNKIPFRTLIKKPRKKKK